MKTIVLTILTCWAFFVASALCFAGVVEHACEACEVGVSCGHESACADDPCGEVSMRPRSPVSDPSVAKTSAGFSVAWPLRLAASHVESCPLVPALRPAVSPGLFIHEMDLPLLI